MSKTRRLQRIFGPDGRTLIVAMDHGGYAGMPIGGNDPGRVISAVVAGGADVIMTTFGLARRYAKEIGRAGLILRVDGGSTQLGHGGGYMSQFLSVEAAVKLGADGVVCMAFPGSEFEHLTLPYQARIGEEAEKWGVALLVEALPRGFDRSSWTGTNLAAAARIAAEWGADMVKTAFTNADDFRMVTSENYIPMVILGGEKAADERQVLESVREALDAGAAGVAMGRNIWQHPHPERITAAVAALIHGNATVDEALKLLK